MASAQTDLAATRINENAAREYITAMHERAVGQGGKFAIASFGQNPATGETLKPKTGHFAIGEVEPTMAFILECSKDEHRNVYCPPALMRLDLKTGAKGSEDDVVAVLGIVADFDSKDDKDSAKAEDWGPRMREAGFEPTMVLETSTLPKPSFQCFVIFDRPVDPRQAKRLAVALAEKTRCDHGSKDVSHVWRIPGLLNWPNKKKFAAGRPAEPQKVRTILPYAKIRLVNPDALTSVPAVDGAEDEVLVPDDLVAPNIDALRIPDRMKHVARTGTDPDKPEKYNSGKDRSAALIAVLMSMVAKGHSVAEMLGLCLLSDSHVSRHVTEQDNPKKYAARQVAQALAKANGSVLTVLNEKHAVVSEEGRTVIINFEHDYGLGRKKISRSSFADLKNRYDNQLLNIDGKLQPRGSWWLRHPKRRQYDAVVFAPGEEPDGCLNLWQGMGVIAANGDWSLMQTHILNNVCSGDEVVFKYLLGWLARCVQHPGKIGEVAIVLRGKQGTGKGFFIREFGQLFGQHFLHIAQASHLTGNFNGHFEDAVVVFADEALWGGDRKGAGVLKALITEPTLPIEAKHRNLKVVKNCTHLLMATNADWAAPADMDDRRFLVLDVSDEHAQDHAYFAALVNQMGGGGREAMLYDMQRHDIKDFDVRSVPKTQALHEQKILGLDWHQKWWRQKLLEGQLLPDDDFWTGEAPTGGLYDDYVQFCGKAGQGRKSVQTELGMRIRQLLPGTYPQKSKMMAVVNDVERRVSSWQFPSLTDCRQHWEDLMGHPEDWPKEEFPVNADDDDYEIPF